MVSNVAIRIDNSVFSDFLNVNKLKINSIVPKNLSISKDDEWRTEDFWDDKMDDE